jgi:hypothetical protein
MPQSAARKTESLQSEEVLLGTCFRRFCADPLTDLGPQHFFSREYQQIARAILALKDAGKPIDYIQVAGLLEEWHSDVRPSTVTGLGDGIPDYKPEELTWYKEDIKRRWQERQIRKELYAMGEAAAAGAPVEDLQLRAVEVLEKSKATGKAATPITENRCPKIPEEAWHPIAREYREVVGPTLPEIPNNFHLACFLTAVGTALCHSVYFNIIRAENLYPNLWSVLVGTSGDPRKGTAMRGILQVLRDAQIYIPTMSSLDSAEGLGRKLLKLQGEDAKNYVPLMISLSELRSFIDKASKEGTRNLIPKMCECYDGTPFEVNTTKDPIIIPEAFAGLIGGTSLAYTETMKQSDLEGGLGNRICFIPGEPQKRKAEAPDPEEPAYSNFTNNLAGIIDYWKMQGTTRLRFDEPTRELWRGFYEDELPTWAPEDSLLSVLTKRFHHHPLKVASIYAALDRSAIIRSNHLGPALLYTRFLLDGIFFTFSNFGLAQWVKDEKKIIETVRLAMPLGIRQRNLQQKYSKMGSEHFQRHLKSLAREESALRLERRGRQIWILTNDN